uniref:Zgc:77938 n=1 Tax=Neogobius melanostomus TaxID=47308 RepID=A0A8C6TF42_9GOBI
MSTQGKVITCKAAVAWMPGKPLKIEVVQVDPPKDHEVRIKVSLDWDGRIITMDHQKPSLKVRMWYKRAGEVESVGRGVTNFQPGDKVIPLFLPHCGQCPRCHSPKTNHCRKNCFINGQQVYQFLGVCSFSQYSVVPDTSLAKIRHDAPLDKVVLLGCGVSTGYGAAINTAKVRSGSSCAVFGLGAVGLSAVMGCKAAGATTIIAIDKNTRKFQKAQEMGATMCINPDDHRNIKIQDLVKEKTEGGVDFALECVGNTAALESTIDAWGVCVIAGWTETEKLSVEVEQLLLGRTIKGTYFGGWKGADAVPALVNKYMAKELKLDEFITHSFTLSEAPQSRFSPALSLLAFNSCRDIISNYEM